MARSGAGLLGSRDRVVARRPQFGQTTRDPDEAATSGTWQDGQVSLAPAAVSVGWRVGAECGVPTGGGARSGWGTGAGASTIGGAQRTTRRAGSYVSGVPGRASSSTRARSVRRSRQASAAASPGTLVAPRDSTVLRNSPRSSEERRNRETITPSRGLYVRRTYRSTRTGKGRHRRGVAWSRGRCHQRASPPVPEATLGIARRTI